LPGRHHAGESYVRVEHQGQVRLRHELTSDWPAESFIPVPVRAGSLLVMNGTLPHRHHPNRSLREVHRVSLLCADLACDYLPENFIALDPRATFLSPWDG
jgi:hypothetical protein